MMNSGYTFDGVDLLDEFDVQVLEVAGPFESPKRKEPTEYDWNDEDGVEVFTDADDIKWQARDIRLKCRIKEETEEDFQVKLGALISTILAPGMHELKLKHHPNTFSVIYKEGNVFEALTKWNDVQNIGSFYLVFREPIPTIPAIWKDLYGHWLMSDAQETETSVYTSDFSADEDGWTGSNATPLGNQDGISDGATSKDNCLKATASGGSATHYVQLASTLTAGKSYNITVIGYIPSANTKCDGFRVYDSTPTLLGSADGQAGTWYTLTMSRVRATGTALRIYMMDGTATTWDQNGDLMYIASVTIEEVEQEDQTDNDIDASPFGVALTTDRKSASNAAYQLDGTDDFVMIRSALQTQLRDSFSFVMWVKPDDGRPPSAQRFCGTQTGQHYFYISLGAAGFIASLFKDGTTLAQAETNVVFSNGAESWHQVACVVDNVRRKILLYFDGAEQTLPVHTGVFPSALDMTAYTNAQYVDIGAINSAGTPSAFFDGAIADVRFYDRALSAEEIKILYNTYNGSLTI